MEKIFVISRQKTYLKIILASRIYPMPPMIEMFSEFKELKNEKDRAISFWKIIIF